jgi:3-oxoacyl-[acyl-carrier protein] reductase
MSTTTERANGRLAGKVALITGAGAGLGAAMARRFRDEGATLIVNDLDGAAAERTAAAVEGYAYAADVADPDAVRAMFARVAADVRQLDVLVNNAGFGGAEGNPAIAELLETVAREQDRQHAAGGPIETHLDVTMHVTDEDWRRMIAVHLDGTFFCSREALKMMAPQCSGCIINMGSIMGTAGMGGVAAYAAAKAGILGFTRALALEVVTRHIRVNALAPGFVETALTAPLAALRPRLEARTPMRRFGEPDDVAWAAVYLASDEAKFVTGQILSPNGGWVMNQ